MNRGVIAVAAMFLLIGCSSYGLKFKETPAGSQSVDNLDEAGSVHVAVVSITPWNDIKAKLRPEIPVDPKTLKDQAIPSTQAMLDKYLSILRLQASLAPTVSRTTSKSTTTTETGKDDNTKTEASTEEAPGTPRAPVAGTALAAGAKPATEVSGITSINSSLALRAMASYKQDVEALNAEVDYAASRTGYEAYLMRVQISVMPRRRHLGYDVYSNLSFFSYSGKSDAATGASVVRDPTAGTPFVVPLLSTDSIETAERAQSIEALRDIGVALDLVKGFGGIGFSANSQKDRQQALQGLDVNSILTLGRLSDNSLRVRFGAANDPGGGYATHPRTNTISVLVFFPKKSEVARMVSRNSWLHVVDGTELRSDGETYSQRLAPVLKQWAHLGFTEDFLRKVDEYPLEGNYQAFEKDFKEHLPSLCKRTGGAEDEARKQSCTTAGHRLMQTGMEAERERTAAYVWSHLLSLLPGGRFSTTVVDLPKSVALCPVAGQLGVYAEIESGIAIALRGGSELGVGNLKAAVHWGLVEAPTPAAVVPKTGTRKSLGKAAVSPAAATSTLSRQAYGLLASEISVRDDRRTVGLTFDTARMVPSEADSKVKLVPLLVEISGCQVAKPAAPPTDWTYARLWTDSQFYPLTARIPKKEKEDTKDKAASVSLNVTTDTLLLDAKNYGNKTVVVDLGEKPESQYALTFSGGDVVAVGPADMITPRNDGSYLVLTSGPVTLRFRMATNQSVDIELHPINEKGKLGASVKKLALHARGGKS
ncbi:hypothetical protein F2P45_11300 [Massilia sp. CCM 8733]|uniref:Uncharacterized protein n=1 Tax=Massilia mucilaginosa TaxID=2609282 RepID=A0ABX0NS10_9BURK|nr:hypothetical protein [Massilia mucilaginosa]NHZ89596.1 hypothetical protein [Massilia mucilaginosa]